MDFIYGILIGAGAVIGIGILLILILWLSILGNNWR